MQLEMPEKSNQPGDAVAVPTGRHHQVSGGRARRLADDDLPNSPHKSLVGAYSLDFGRFRENRHTYSAEIA